MRDDPFGGLPDWFDDLADGVPYQIDWPINEPTGSPTPDFGSSSNSPVEQDFGFVLPASTAMPAAEWSRSVEPPADAWVLAVLVDPGSGMPDPQHWLTDRYLNTEELSGTPFTDPDPHDPLPEGSLEATADHAPGTPMGDLIRPPPAGG